MFNVSLGHTRFNYHVILPFLTAEGGGAVTFVYLLSNNARFVLSLLMYSTILCIDLHHTDTVELIPQVHRITEYKTQCRIHSALSVDPMNIPSLSRFPAI